MTETLYIRLAASDEQVSWSLHTPQSGFGHVQVGSLDDALLLSRERRLVVMLPSADITLTTVELPAQLQNVPQARLLQAIPYLLEDRLAEDVETLHFAIGRRIAGAQLTVVIASRERIDSWLKPFHDRRVMPAVLVPDVLCLPLVHEDSQPVWSVLLEETRASIRCDVCAGFSCETDMLADFLTLTEAPDNLHLQIYPVEHAELPALKQPLQTAASVNNGLEYLLRGYDEAHSINLLQGEFASVPDYLNWFQPWRMTAALLAAWLIVGTATQAIDYLRLRHELKGLEGTAEVALRAAFPQTKSIVDLRTQAQQQLAILKRSGGIGGFLPLLQGTSQVLSQLQGIELQEIQFREGTLHLALLASNTQALETLQQNFGRQSGLQVEIEAANASNQGVQIRAAVKTKS